MLDGQSEDDLDGASDGVRSDGSGGGEARGRREKGKKKGVGGVQPGTQGLGEVMTAEVSCTSCSAANPATVTKLMTTCMHQNDLACQWDTSAIMHHLVICISSVNLVSSCQGCNVNRHAWT